MMDSSSSSEPDEVELLFQRKISISTMNNLNVAELREHGAISIDTEEDVEETSKRYLAANSAPVHRWSMGMIPPNLAETFQHPTRKRKPLVRGNSTEQSKSFDEECLLVRSETGIGDEDPDCSMLDLEKGSSIPVILDTGSERITTKRLGLKNSSWIAERMKHLVQAYADRGEFVRKALQARDAARAAAEQEEEEDDDDDEDEDDKDPTRARATQQQLVSVYANEWKSEIIKTAKPETTNAYQQFWATSYAPQSRIFVLWLLTVSLAFIYNAVFIPFRMVFPEQPHYRKIFLAVDIVADIIYLLDIIWFRPRLKFLENGHWIATVREMHRNYFRSGDFLLGLLSTFPADWLLLTVVSSGTPTVPSFLAPRLNRLVKMGHFWEFFERIDKMANSPYLFRIIHTLMYELYIIHLGACLFYYVSKRIGFGSTPWVYNNQGNAYLRCFYFAFRTTTSIAGRLPKPSTEFERIYMMVAWLLGVFVFAMVIGQIRDIVAHATRNQNYYIDALNKIAAHMNRLNVPPKLQKRVRFWFKFTWDLQKTFNEMEIIQMLPLKMRTDLVLSIHAETLSRVQLFRNINRSVLRDLILKLRPILFLPGDYVCRKGDVGREMYIVNKGTIQVCDPTTRKVLATLGEGSVFGEIAILNLHGQTKRTADVRSCGYSQLFALKKQDLWETLRHYPEYAEMLKHKVERIVRKKQRMAAAAAKKETDKQQQQTIDIDAGDNPVSEPEPGDRPASGTIVKVESIVKERPSTPRLFATVLQVAAPNAGPTMDRLCHRAYSLRHQNRAAFLHQRPARPRLQKQRSLDSDL